MENLKLQYRDLEQRTLANLRYEIKSSKEYSKHIQEKCIRVNVFDYIELSIVNDELAFLDKNGFQYSIWNGDCSLEDLIDILTENSK
jgi:hypothetical protein